MITPCCPDALPKFIHQIIQLDDTQANGRYLQYLHQI